MTSRARDVVPLTIGLYLLLLGVIFLLDSTGAHTIGAAGMVGSAFGLAFVGMGVLAVLAAIRVRRFSRRLRRAVGHVRSAEGGWSLEDGVVATVLGDIALDLRDAELPEGETELTLLCWVGAIHVRAPSGVGLDVTAQTMLGSVELLGRREEGVVRDVQARTPDYERYSTRVKMRLSTFIGELSVV